jgi:hypothetical protein
MLPAIVINNQELRMIDMHKMIHLNNVLPGFKIGGYILGTPIFVVQTPDHYGRMRFNQYQHAYQFFTMICTAAQA